MVDGYGILIENTLNPFVGIKLLQRQYDETESQLIRQAVKQDPDAFTALYDRHVDRVYRHVYYRLYSHTDADDITQEVSVRPWKAIGRYKEMGAPFSAWLITIARNLVTDHYKARKKSVPLEKAEGVISDSGTDPVVITEAGLDRSQIRNAVLQLKGDKQKVIMMRFIDGYSHEEIAKAMRKSEGAVRVIQYRALKDLKDILGRC